MEDIVFSGTTSRKAHGYAEVTMTIENQNRELPLMVIWFPLHVVIIVPVTVNI